VDSQVGAPGPAQAGGAPVEEGGGEEAGEEEEGEEGRGRLLKGRRARGCWRGWGQKWRVSWRSVRFRAPVVVSVVCQQDEGDGG